MVAAADLVDPRRLVRERCLARLLARRRLADRFERREKRSRA